MSFTDAQLQVVKNIRAIQVKNPVIPLLAMLAMTKQESEWNDQAVNLDDPGGSYGPFQLNQQAHPGTAFVATNPWYDYGYYEVRDRWQSVWVQQQNDGLWADESSRPMILSRFAPAAQGSIGWSIGLAQQRYADAVAALEAIS